MKNRLIAVLFVFIAAGFANAALLTIGTATYGGSDYKLIYDTDDQLTWLDYSRPGVDYYSGSLAWAASLNNPGELTINLDPGYTALWGAEQWRLPAATGSWGYYSSEQYITDSEIQYLYYDELGNIENDPSVNTGSFDNLVVDLSWNSWYWLEPADFDSGPTYAPVFSYYSGTQKFTTVSVNGGIYAMAVISGAVVPEPATLSLLAIGGLLMRRRR